MFLKSHSDFHHDFIRPLKQCLLSCSLWLGSRQTAEKQTLCSRQTERDPEKGKKTSKGIECFLSKPVPWLFAEVSHFSSCSLSVHHKYASAVDNDLSERRWSFISHIPSFFLPQSVLPSLYALHIFALHMKIFI